MFTSFLLQILIFEGENKFPIILQGFGVSAKSTQECRHADPMTIVAFHQADIGEYIRNEEALT